MGNALDVLTFLAFAAALGLGIGTVLGVLALVLAAPAHAAGEAAAGRLLLHRVSGESAVAAPLVSTETTFRANGPILRVRVVQAFRNSLQDRQEGLYVAQLPDNATLDRLAVRLRPRAEEDDDESAEEEADEAAEAAASYAVLSGAEGSDVVSRAITGIEPGETVTIELEYQQVVRYDRGKSGMRILTRAPLGGWASGRRRRWPVDRYRRVPLGVEGAWLSRHDNSARPPWLWLLPVVLLYVAVAFFN
jgi:Ca-activated chloride channel family protein